MTRRREECWVGAIETDGPGGALIEQDCPPIRVMHAFEPIAVTEPRPGVRVYDLGQNFSGRPRITVRGGGKVTLRPGELLDDAGLVTQQHTGSPVSFSFTARDAGEQSWHPRFSYTGFRYLQAEGDIAAIEQVEGQFMHAALPVVGQFSCSNEQLNRIHDLILAAIRSNMQSVLTDCPHREKLGWLEQAHLMAPSIMANFDASRFLAKICRDMREAQHDNGCVPTIAPQYTSFKPPWDVFNDSPEWGSAIVLSAVAGVSALRRPEDSRRELRGDEALRRVSRHRAWMKTGSSITAWATGTTSARAIPASPSSRRRR